MIRCTALTLLCLFGAVAEMRPPAVPLVAHDPYFSIWSMADHLNSDGTKHWTGKPNTLTAYARIDGKSYRIMGRERQAGNELAQTRLEVLPTRTIYEFAGAGAKVGLTFFTPALPDDLDVLSRPLTYLEWTAASGDGREHTVEIYFDAGGDLVVNTPDQPVLAARYQLDGFPLLRMGSREQGVLAKRGDDLRIDWATSTWRPIGPRVSRTSQAIVRRREPRSMLRGNCRTPTSLGKCGVEGRCWPPRSCWAK